MSKLGVLTKTKIEPLDDCIVVRPEEEVGVSKGGIVIARVGDKPHASIGTVIAVGPGVRWADSKDGPKSAYIHEDGVDRVKMALKVGDRVMFPAYGPHDVTLDNEDLRVMREKDVLAVLR